MLTERAGRLIQFNSILFKVPIHNNFTRHFTHSDKQKETGDSGRNNFPLRGRKFEQSQTRWRRLSAATAWEREGERRDREMVRDIEERGR